MSIKLKYALIPVLVFCANAFAYTVASGQKLPPHVTYSCSDDDQAALVGALTIWNHVCDGYFTFERVDQDAIISVVTRDIGYGFDGLTAQQGYTAKISINTATHDRDAAMLHEVGHAFGMGHSTDHDSVMNTAVSHQFVNQDDIDGIRSIYGLSPKIFGPIIKQKAHTVKAIGSELTAVVFSDGFIMTKKVVTHTLPRGVFTLEFYCAGVYGKRSVTIK